MFDSSHPTRPLRLALLVAVMFAATPSRAAISVAITPATQTVTPGSDFDLFVDVTAAGTAFNGYELVVEYDPAALTFVPLAPTTLQQGCLMTGACSGACGVTFHQFQAAGDSLKVNNVLLCNLVSLSGPGRLYQLRFHASSTPQATNILVRRMRFYDAGLLVGPVNTANAVVGIGVAVGVDGTPPATGVTVRVEPNPSRGSVAFVVSHDSPWDGQVDVLDLQGRLVRRLAAGNTGAPTRWDGTDAHGARVSPGVYMAQVRGGGRAQYIRFVLLP